MEAGNSPAAVRRDATLTAQRARDGAPVAGMEVSSLHLTSEAVAVADEDGA